jgi:site-specific DNA-methyltransferase (adenine-specific)
MTNKIFNGDCLDILPTLPSNSVDLCIIDPPYFKIKQHYWDNQWSNTELFLKWMEMVFNEIYRVLKPSGSIYCFAYPKMSFEIESELRKKFNILNHIVWEKYNDKGFDGWLQKTSKEALRKYYPNSERIIFAEKQSFGKMLKEERIKNGLSTIKLAELIGAHGNTNHGGSVSNWESDLNIPTNEQYEKLLKYVNLPKRTEVIRTFNSKKDIQYTDVLHFKTVRPYKDKHPCEKPNDLLKHLIEMSSNENDIVLDCFSGSGALGQACIDTNRNFILIEKDYEYYKKSTEKLNYDK